MAGLKIISRIAAAMQRKNTTDDMRFNLMAAQIKNLRQRIEQLERLQGRQAINNPGPDRLGADELRAK